MNKQSIKLVLFFIIGMLAAFLVMYFITDYQTEKVTSGTVVQTEYQAQSTSQAENSNTLPASNEIDELTADRNVIDYVKQNKALPDYYLTKAEARKQGWVASKGNLCDVLPGKAIGGDKFSNREKTLPNGKQYFEADVNYSCGRRNADRIVYTKNG